MTRKIISPTGQNISITPTGKTKVPTPTSNTNAATKGYVDGIGQRGLMNVHYYTASTTWTKPANFTANSFVLVTVVGGGGGGGSAEATTVSQYSCGSSGGGGAAAIKKIMNADLNATETVTIGAAGSGASAAADNATAGGTSSFGSHCSATGGGAGARGIATTTANQLPRIAGGIATGGDINIEGGSSTNAKAQINPLTGLWPSISGGSIFSNVVNVYDGDGISPSGYGGGGAAASCGVDKSNRAGGNGADGIVIVEEYL
jgi:hypothetical protein